MRPPATEKCGYYPTHSHVVEVIKTYIAPAEVEKKARLLDPCCGEGTAASMLGNALNCETWGTELSYKRAETAASVLDKVHNCAWESTWINQESVTLLFLNPPYDSDGFDKKGRLEYQFLKSTTPVLVRGGLLVYIVPQKLFADPDVAKRLAAYYENFTIGLYKESVYHQVVLLATKRDSLHHPSTAEVEAIQAWAITQLEDLAPAEEPVYSLLPGPVKNKYGAPVSFTRKDWTDEEKAEATLTKGVMTTSAWKDMLSPDRATTTDTLQPCMPLKKGHVAMLMASGMTGILRIQGTDGKPMLVKGRVVKKQDTTVEIADNGDKIEKFKDRFVTTITVATQKEIKVIDEVEGLTEFMKEYGDKVADCIFDSYRPRYNMNPTDKENAILDTLGKNGKCLPGQREPGLLPTQRHASIAMARSIKANRVGNIQGEMGLGKTRVAAGTLALLESKGFPALIICPPHLVNKWIREVEEVIPGAKGFELRRIGKNADDPGDINDVRKFLEQYDAGLIGEKPVAVVATTSSKMGSGWQASVVVRQAKTPNSKRRVTACCCPVCGSPVMDDEGYVICDPAELSKKRYFCQGEIPGWELDEDGFRQLDDEGNPIWGKRKCGTALFSYNQTRRVSIAEYINKHFKGRFKVLVADEVHQEKGKSSDRAVAFHQLVRACNSTLTLTGTFFGGKSTSIFWLLHRLNPSVRRDFGFNDETRWANAYGVLEVTRRSKNNEDDEDGYFTGNRRYRNTAKEQPGISPAIINRLLDTTAFLSLKDLGIGMPEYHEKIQDLDMLEDQSFQYRSLDSQLKDLARKNGRYLSTWLQWSLARPNSAFRDEKVVLDEYDEDGVKTNNKIELINLPRVDGDLPKEEWLATFCKEERLKNRKVLVYVRQTGTRDIQDHIQSVLEQNGLRVTVLHGNIDPRKREDWIAKRTPTTDVLVCNPKLVETGLDLIAYSTVVFAEMEYSLYTLWQAVRRVWRLGQTNPVLAIFCVYKDTMESRAMTLMGKKMKAAQLLYGDEVGGAIVPAEDGDFLTQLARDVLSGKKMSDLQALFAENNTISHDPIGCITKPSEVMTVPLSTWEQWLQEHGAQISPKRSSRSKPAPAGQASLF